MLKIDARDVLQFAIRIEEDGEMFYSRAAFTADDKNVADLFNELAAEEVRHKLAFEDLLSRAKEIAPPESYPGEYIGYLRDYIDGKIVFSRSKKTELENVHDVAAALDFAIGREADSITYYQELRAYVSPGERPPIEKIINEERTHLEKLSGLRKNYP